MCDFLMLAGPGLLAGPYDGQIPVLILQLQNDVGKQMYMDNWSGFFLVKYTVMFN